MSTLMWLVLATLGKKHTVIPPIALFLYIVVLAVDREYIVNIPFPVEWF